MLLHIGQNAHLNEFLKKRCSVNFVIFEDLIDTIKISEL